MKIKRVLLRSLVVYGVLAISLECINTTVLANTDSNNASYEEVDAYVQRHMDRLHIPGASLAIVEGDKIVHLHGLRPL